MFVDRCLSFCPFPFGHCVVSRRVFGYLEPGRTLRTGSEKWQQRFRMSMLFLSSATVSDINNKNKLTIVFAMPSFKYYKWIDKNVLIVEFSEKICESLTLVAYIYSRRASSMIVLVDIPPIIYTRLFITN